MTGARKDTSRLISVIVPVYNTRAFLVECVESVLCQTYSDFELLLIDDGSTDGCAQMCDELDKENERIKTIHQDHGGLSRARNTGLDHARGEYAVFVDSDDMVHPRFLEVLLAAMGDGQISKCGRVKSEKCYWPDHEGRVRQKTPKQAICDVLYQRHDSNTVWAHLIHRSVYAKFRFTPGILYEDLDGFYRLYELSEGPINISPQKLYFYRQREGSILHEFTPERWHVLEITDKIVDYYRDDAELSGAAMHRQFSAYFNMLALAACNGQKGESKRRCWPMVKRLRNGIIRNKKARPKNRVGALVSYLGFDLTSFILRFAYR